MHLNKRTIDVLPAASAAALAHSAEVAGHIRGRMDRSGGSISFAEFMQEALYAPGLGYYSAGTAKFGHSGDFVTAPEIGPLFGRLVARQSAVVLQSLPGGAVLELGAGSGSLAAAVLSALGTHGIEPRRYLILEVSADLAARQEKLVRAQVPELYSKVEWLDRLPRRFQGIVIANEVADALPVERFRKRDTAVRQVRVGYDRRGFIWRDAEAPAFLTQAVSHIEKTIGHALPDGFVSEVSTGLPAWMGDVAACIERGYVFLFDYGLSRREYYAPDRSAGWLRCHFRHHAHDDPLIHPGIQDLSAWVDFTAVAEAAVAAGLAVAGYVTQSQFVRNSGLTDELQDFERLPNAAQIELSREVKILTMPGEMGENFKCMGLSRGSVPDTAAFANGDRAHGL
jgi:SAM-dependent MidA family methyltransferase